MSKTKLKKERKIENAWTASIIDSIVGIRILIGVWWTVFASHNGDIKEVAKALREFIDKNVGRDK